MSEYQKLQDMLEVYEKILHPDFFFVFKKQLNAVYEENKKEAYKAAKISDEALKIEGMLKNMCESIEQHKSAGHSTKMFFIKCFYKELLEILDKRIRIKEYL